MNNSLTILREYEQFGCEILSIVDDIPKQKIGETSTLQTLLFEHNKSTNNVIIYTGVKHSSNPLMCFWTNAFVLYNNDLKKCSVNPFGKGAQIRMNINMIQARKSKVYQEIKTDKEALTIGINCRKEIIKFADPFYKIK